MEKVFKQEKFEIRMIPERNQFKHPLKDKLTEEEQCLVDNIWSLSTTAQSSGRKATCVQYLINYLVSGKHKDRKPFTCYVLYSGRNAGIYLTWEEISREIELYKLDARAGNPFYKGFYNLEEAMTSLTSRLGEEFVISPQVLKWQEYQRHLEQFPDQDFIKTVETGTSSFSSGTPLKLAPQTPQKLTKTYLETTAGSSKLKEKEIPLIGKIRTPVATFPKHPITTPGETSLKTFTILQECLEQLASSSITYPGISSSWEFTFSPFKTCQLFFPDCHENQEGIELECLCKLDSAIRRANLSLPIFKPFKFRDYTVSFSTFLKHGLLNSVNVTPVHDFSSTLPELLAETLEPIISDLLVKFRLDFTSLYPDFQENKPAYHLLEIFFHKIDDDYKGFDDCHQEPKTIKLEDSLELQIDMARAKILASNFNWQKSKFAGRNLLREDTQGKIYCDSGIASQHFYPFDISHSKPRLVQSYRRYLQKKAAPKRDLLYSSGSEQGDPMHQ